MIKHLFLILLMGIAIGGCGNTINRNNAVNEQQNDLLELQTTKTADGWAYTISVNGKPYIKQTMIPAVSGNHPIENQPDAQKLGARVLQKMKDKQPPIITRAGLLDLGLLDASSQQNR